MNKAQWKKTALREIEERIGEFEKLLGDVIRIPTDNPPGDTTACVGLLSDHLKSCGLPVDIYEPKKGSPNLISYHAGGSGPNLVLNGHIDQFPVNDKEQWSFDPYSGECRDGKILGRGSGDMKAGSVASLLCLQLFHELKIPLEGQLTLTLVSDEESGSRWGSRWLLDNVPITRGDSCLNSEPTRMTEVLIGHKGMFWLRVTINGPGGHAALPSDENAVAMAMKIARAVKAIQGWKLPPPAELAGTIELSKSLTETGPQTSGQGWVVDSTTVNIGSIKGGVQANTIPPYCEMEIDLRPPIGITGAQLKAKVEEAIQSTNLNTDLITTEWYLDFEPAYSSPEDRIVQLTRDNAEEITKEKVDITTSYGSTDTRFWWAEGIPAAVYGTDLFNIGEADECIPRKDFENCIKVHMATAIDYLCS
jgi:succinyl-diaminopimelate desuccinylase